MSENKITFPAKLASNNPQSFGIVNATEVSGYKSVGALSDLYSISGPMLSILKDGSDAIGQEWFVVSENCKYRLDNWANRNTAAGWTKLPNQELINTKQSVSEKDQPSGYAGLDSNGKVPIEKTYGTTATVVDVATYESLPAVGLDGVIYYVSNTGAQYKWSGSSYIDITNGADNAKKNETSIFDCSNGTSTKYYSSLSDAINVVPPAYRTSNRIISYLSTENSTTSAVNYQYHGIDSTTWTDLTKWERIPNQTDLVELRSDLNELEQEQIQGGVYDVSSHNDCAVFESLSTLLGSANLSTLIPTSVRRGGMSIRFIQGSAPNSDNKYVQYRLTVDEWSVDIEDWVIADEGAYVDSPEFVYVKTDDEDKILWGIKVDGSIYYGAGVPQQIVDYIEEKIADLSLDEYEDIVVFLNNLEKGDKTLQILLNEKVDREEGKSLIDGEYASTKSTIENPEFLEATTDSEDKILEGLQADGTKVIGSNLKVIGNMEVAGISYKIIENPEYLAAWVDAEDKVIFGLRADGKTYVGDADFIDEIKNNQEAISEIKTILGTIGSTIESLDVNALSFITVIENSEFLEAKTDSEGKLLAGRTPDGEAFEKVGFSTPKVSIDGHIIDGIEDHEGRIEISIDANSKIISYRDKYGVKHEEVGIETNHLGLSEEGMTEFQNALKNSGFNPGGTGDWSDYISNDGDNPLCIPQPRNIVLVNILSDLNLINLSKSTTSGAVEGVTYDVHTDVEFWDMNGNYFKKPALMSGQGNSSMQFPKKNIAFDFFDSEINGDAFAVKFGDWVPQDSWHLKAYYTDAFRCIGLGGYKLYDEIVKTRGVMEDYVYKKALIDFSKIGYVSNGYNDLKDLSLQYETGAKCFPDGFPVIVYQNGVFFGLYCWQIKKHRDNYHMKKSNKKHIHLDGTLNSTTLFNGNISWTDFEVRNPKNLIDMDGEEYNGDIPKELIDSSSQNYNPNDTNHVNTAAVKQYIINFSNVMSILNTAKATYNTSPKTAEDLAVLKATFEEYFDVDNLIDYLIISDVSRNYDGFEKNWQWLTYDGVKWFLGLYDCDGMFGGNFTGTSNILPLNGRHITNYLMYNYITTYYNSELEDRYAELRQNKIIDKDNIIKIINRIFLLFGEQNIEKEFSKWTDCPCNRDVVLNENWEFDLDENGNPQLGTANYNNSITYNAGDSCFYAQYPGNGEATYKYKAKATVTGVKPVDSFGYRDSIYRLYNWIKKSIENMDIVYSYNNL